MSYTSFKISNVKTDKRKYTLNDKIKITCQVKNTGNLDGSEVVQIYVGKPNSKVKRALKELKGFQKINLSAGTKSNIEINIDAKSLSFYDESISDWNLEKGRYNIYVGNASNNISKEIKIEIE